MIKTLIKLLNMFMPSKWKNDILENPIKLIDKKIKNNNLSNLSYVKGIARNLSKTPKEK